MMKKIVILMLIFFGVCVARNDPFTPTIVPEDSIRPYYGESSVFDSAKIDFPSTARLIKKVEVTFQNLDGSIETKSVALSGRIDWQVPLLVTQILNKNQRYALSNIENKMPPPAPKNSMVKDINIPLDKKMDAIKIAESSVKIAESNKKIAESNKKSTKKAPDSAKAQNPPKQILDSAKSQNLQNSQNPQKSQNLAQKKALDSAKFTPYTINGKSIFIAYGGRIKRHFVMQNPYRIVMDFEINKKFYKQNRYTLNSPHFKRLKYGLHTKFLRIVLEMNGSYIYELGVREDGVQINVK